MAAKKRKNLFGCVTAETVVSEDALFIFNPILCQSVSESLNLQGHSKNNFFGTQALFKQLLRYNPRFVLLLLTRVYTCASAELAIGRNFSIHLAIGADFVVVGAEFRKELVGVHLGAESHQVSLVTACV